MPWNMGRKGWPGLGLDDASLTATFHNKSFWIPAAAMSGGAGNEEPIFQNKHIAAQHQCLDVWTFTDDSDQYVFWSWPFKAHEIDVGTPLFRALPIWFQDEDSTAPSGPSEFVYWEFFAGNRQYDGDLNFAANATNVKWQSTVLDQWHVVAGDTADDQNAAGGFNVQGDALAATDWNFLFFGLERETSDPLDTWAGKEAHLLGILFQYATDFANIAQWPSI